VSVVSESDNETLGSVTGGGISCQAERLLVKTSAVLL
jgi:hypothetical protein